MSNSKIYHAIFLGGNKWLVGGRILAGFRLRTEARKHGYETLVVDTAPVLTPKELMRLLESVVTLETLVIGISTVWLGERRGVIEWITDDFLQEIKQKFSHVKLICGGPAGPVVHGASTVYKNSDWSLIGFSDISFTKLLDYLSGKKDHGLMYFVDPSDGKKIVKSDEYHKILVPNEIETILEKEDRFLSHQPIPIEIGRGCIFRCSFCSHPFQGAKDYDSYQRTPENIALELKRNYDLFGTTRYVIMDDTFNDSMEKLDRLHRAIDLANLPNFKFVSYLKPELVVTKPKTIDKLKSLGLAGGFVGLESLNNFSRKSVKKGMDIDRVIDSLKLLRQRTDVKLEASFIIGLPGDSLENQLKTQEFMINNQNEFCVEWHYNALGMYRSKDGKGSSDIDTYPEQYGYRILNKDRNYRTSLVWENDNMNYYQANSLSEKLNNDIRDIVKPGGWNVATGWYLGMSDEVLETQSIKQMNLFAIVEHFERRRATEMLKKYNISDDGSYQYYIRPKINNK
jgi:hypothetical protein